MGFKILPYEEGDDQKYDVFTITSKKHWNPQKHKKLCAQTQECSIISQDEDSSIDNSLQDLRVKPEISANASIQESISVSTLSVPDLSVRNKDTSVDSSGEESDESPIPSEVMVIIKKN